MSYIYSLGQFSITSQLSTDSSAKTSRFVTSPNIVRVSMPEEQKSTVEETKQESEKIPFIGVGMTSGGEVIHDQTNVRTDNQGKNSKEEYNSPTDKTDKTDKTIVYIILGAAAVVALLNIRN